MTREFRSTRDVIIRSTSWDHALKFYGSVLSLPVVYSSEDLSAARRRLLAAGCVIEEENSSLPRCYIRDPFGLVFNIGQTRD
jgi:predicted enzyme related to lactoylglutathione lyase